MEKEKIFALLSNMIEQQKEKSLTLARRFVPYATPEDILQPNDFSELENNPAFRYEEGILDGLQCARASLQAFFKECEID